MAPRSQPVIFGIQWVVPRLTESVFRKTRTAIRQIIVPVRGEDRNLGVRFQPGGLIQHDKSAIKMRAQCSHAATVRSSTPAIKPRNDHAVKELRRATPDLTVTPSVATLRTQIH